MLARDCCKWFVANRYVYGFEANDDWTADATTVTVRASETCLTVACRRPAYALTLKTKRHAIRDREKSFMSFVGPNERYFESGVLKEAAALKRYC